ncbi:MAG: hypothetical protein HKN76_01295 [Saprospiraceae bacterium]|nr:hypothetical protein [Saprospiraceae bacterium]
MAILILNHKVADYAAWRPIYDGDVQRRSQAGFKELAVGTQSDDPSMVYMIWEGDPAVVRAMLADPELGAKMKEAGVVSAPELIVVNT